MVVENHCSNELLAAFWKVQNGLMALGLQIFGLPLMGGSSLYCSSVPAILKYMGDVCGPWRELKQPSSDVGNE